MKKRKFENMKWILPLTAFLILAVLMVYPARLPTVGGDTNEWGTILNEYLNVSLNQDGSIRNNTGIVPVGSIVSWLKSYTNTPALPDNFVECNGQTLSDADSVFNGQVIPDLNGGNRFLRGAATSGATGGSSTHNHQWGREEVSAGDTIYSIGAAGAGELGASYDSNGAPIDFTSYGDDLGPVNLYTSNTPTLPPYYDVVWIMRIK